MIEGHIRQFASFWQVELLAALLWGLLWAVRTV